ncbi:hypothetical protein ACFWFI_04965 [Streptomyces sp. NPDC060209]|uniref:hypothetical protein n=1 Tax=Streptomyces sp. NPDC060209 TaxID=3347073 RepID=UPI0036508C67
MAAYAGLAPATRSSGSSIRSEQPLPERKQAAPTGLLSRRAPKSVLFGPERLWRTARRVRLQRDSDEAGRGAAVGDGARPVFSSATSRDTRSRSLRPQVSFVKRMPARPISAAPR